MYLKRRKKKKKGLTKLHSFFKTLIDHEVTVGLKNDIQIKGTLKSVDQYLNIKLDDIQVVEELKYPHLVTHPQYPPLPFFPCFL
jgi:small nuclear ribonucleoprotein (snRNP)-like protein